MSSEYRSDDSYSSDDSQVSEYAPSATPESEDYSSCESSSLETPSESSDSEDESQETLSD